MTSVSHARQRGRTLSRRDFLSYAWWATFGVLTAQVVGATGLFLWPKVKAGSFGGKVNLGKVAELPPVGSITYFQEAQLYLSRLPEGLLAMWRKCPHLGCVVPWRPEEKSEDNIAPTGRFNCPCHASIYNRYGQIIAGPAPRPLDLFPIELDSQGNLIVDTAAVIQRPEGFRPEQIVKI